MRYYVNFAFKSFFCIEIDVFFSRLLVFFGKKFKCAAFVYLIFAALLLPLWLCLLFEFFKFYCFKLFLAKLSVAIQMELTKFQTVRREYVDFSLMLLMFIIRFCDSSENSKEKKAFVFFFSYSYHLILLNNFTLNICSQFVSCFTKCKLNKFLIDLFLHELKKKNSFSFSFSSKKTYESVRFEVESKLYNIEQHLLKFVNHIEILCTHLTRFYIENCLFLS